MFNYNYLLKKLCSRLSYSEVQFSTKNGHFAFLSPLWAWEGFGNVHCSMFILGSQGNAKWFFSV